MALFVNKMYKGFILIMIVLKNVFDRVIIKKSFYCVLSCFGGSLFHDD